MKSVNFSRLLLSISLYLFLPLSLLIAVFYQKILLAGLDPVVLIAGNVILYLITLIAMYMHLKGLANKNPHAFFRSVYGSMLLRMFICIIAVIVYAILSGDKISKYSLLICFLFYFLYSFFELRLILSRMKK